MHNYVGINKQQESWACNDYSSHYTWHFSTRWWAFSTVHYS